jgi:Mechanosensitive ion channel, conserved TM helix
MGEEWRTAISDSLHKFVGKLVAFLPNLLAMLTIFIVGLFVAWLVKVVLLRFLKAIQFDKVSQRWGITHALAKGGMSYSPAQLLSRFFYWVCVLITMILGIDALEVAATRNFVSEFFNYVPHLFAAVLILVVGYLMALFLGQAALIAAVNAQMESAKLLGRVVRWFILILSLTTALYHLEIAKRVIVAAFSITFGGIALSLAIAFGRGGKEVARDFLENMYKR